ncbi:ATP-binding protein [Roseateles chitinivorans]|uniref:ATP-binding protein n=1 Tax=Roseateles chitinivorans TaxID=2917965 RepID=UPI003D67EB70
MLQLIHRVLDRFRGAARPDTRFGVLPDPAIFRRPELASRMASELMSYHHASGLFLTAPRRTGKSTFIRHDLKPALEQAYGALVLYADLWGRRNEDPGAVIVELINQAVLSHESRARRAFGRVSLSRFRAPGVEWELKKERGEREPSLCESLERLSDRAGQTVVLVVDEVQQTQATSLGRDVLYMLKSARDELNGRRKLKFRFVATGSHNEKIQCLVSDKHQAFYMAPLEVLPTLWEENYFLWARSLHGPRFTPSLSAMARAFEICLRRPEPFHQACCGAAAMAHLSREMQEQMLLCLAREQIEAEKCKLYIRLRPLKLLDQALLRLLAEDGLEFGPYFPAARQRLMAMLSVVPDHCVPEISETSIDMALQRLCQAKLVWRGDGPYALEESQFAQWLLERDPVIVAPTPTSLLPRAQAAEVA